jgi:hypothetical protein
MTGFADSIYGNPSTVNPWLKRTVATAAQLVLLPVDWASIAPQPPPSGTDPSDPSNPAYNWGTLDQTVRATSAHGLTVAFTVAGGGGPAWADGPNRPPSETPGTWRPSAAAFGAFAKAVARRYSGSFNPGGGVLPHVRYFEAWSEPNLDGHLAPQWIQVNRQWIAESPIIYRGLLNAFYAGVKSVNPANMVITGGTAPFGDPPGGGRMAPAEFVRELLCLHGQGLAPERCPDPAHFDILGHHPYSIGGPWWRAINADEASVPDIWKLTRPLAVAERTGRLLPRGYKPVWATEYEWESSPPDPGAVPIMKRARWIEESFYVLWRQGVDAIAWFLLADEPPIPSYATTYQSGMYYANGRVKPALEGFRFPFVIERAGRGRVILWGTSPVAGRVLVQRRAGRTWGTVATFAVRAHGIFTRTISISGRPLMRARVGGETSLTWSAP